MENSVITYRNAKHYKLAKILISLEIACGFAGMALYVVFALADKGEYVESTLYTCSILLIMLGFTQQKYSLTTLTIDKSAGTVSVSSYKNCPIRLSEMKTITYRKNRRGKFIALDLHDTGVVFFDFKTTKDTADQIVAQLLEANPSIDVLR